MSSRVFLAKRSRGVQPEACLTCEEQHWVVLPDGRRKARRSAGEGACIVVVGVQIILQNDEIVATVVNDCYQVTRSTDRKMHRGAGPPRLVVQVLLEDRQPALTMCYILI